MQKTSVRLTTFVVIFLAALFSWITPSVSAAETNTNYYTLANVVSFSEGVHTPARVKNPLLTEINTQKHWNLVYQQNPAMPMVTAVQYHPELHLFVSTAGFEPAQDTGAPVPVMVPTLVTGEVLGDASIEPSVGVDEIASKTITGPEIVITKSEPVVQKPVVAIVSEKPVTIAKPVATAPAPALAPSDLDGLFATYAAQYGLSASMLKHIAICESGLNPGALSKNGLYGGLFQFVSSTWSSNRTAMGLDPNPALRFNAEEAIKTAAFKISRDGVGAWPVCGRKATATLASAEL